QPPVPLDGRRRHHEFFGASGCALCTALVSRATPSAQDAPYAIIIRTPTKGSGAHFLGFPISVPSPARRARRTPPCFDAFARRWFTTLTSKEQIVCRMDVAGRNGRRDSRLGCPLLPTRQASRPSLRQHDRRAARRYGNTTFRIISLTSPSAP